MCKITIYPKKELKERLDDEAKKEERSLNKLILIILNKYFKEKKG